MSPTDAALRDLSAASLKEFIYWSIKQSTPQVNYYTTEIMLIRLIIVLFMVMVIRR